MAEIADHLARHDFKSLFIEELGWDHPLIAPTSLNTHTRGRRGAGREPVRPIALTPIAQKRGVYVLSIAVSRHEIVDRVLLRTLQSKAFGLSGEHILIATCEDDKEGAGSGWRKQVWQWMVFQPGSGEATRTLTRHREHPFRSTDPPPALLARLEELSFSFAEEEQVSSLDASARIRKALDARAEKLLFVNSPWYAREGDRLAQLMVQERSRVENASEKRPALNDFVLFHHRLCHWTAMRISRMFPGIDAEDAAQSAFLALRRAANRFDPAMGFQFSTYAVAALRKEMLRVGPQLFLNGAASAGAFRRYRDDHRVLQRWLACYGEVGRSVLQKWWSRRGGSGEPAGTSYWMLEDLLDRETVADHAITLGKSRRSRSFTVDTPRLSHSPLDELCDLDSKSDVWRALDGIPAREREVLELRFGLAAGDSALTLSEVGAQLMLTKERIRQIELHAIELLRAEYEALAQPTGRRCEPRSAKRRRSRGFRRSRNG